MPGGHGPAWSATVAPARPLAATGAEQECTLHTKGQGEVAAYAAVERVACAGQLDGYVLVCTLFLRPAQPPPPRPRRGSKG